MGDISTSSTAFAEPFTDAVTVVRRRRTAPLTVAVCGHPGVGSATVAAALRSRFRLSCTMIGESDALGPEGCGAADLLVRVVGAGPRRCDGAACATRTPLIVVANKADVRDDAAASARIAEDSLRRPVLPVSALLAAVSVGPADRDMLRCGDVDDDLLRRFGVRGVEVSRNRLAAEPDLSTSALADVLFAESGFAAVACAIRDASWEVAERRDRRLRADLRLLAARGVAREDAEHALIGARS